MKQKYTYMVMCALVLLLGFSACDKDAHENEYPVPDGRGGLVIGLETEGGAAEDVHFFVFDASERLAHHEYFDNPQKAALYFSYLTPSIYTAVAVFNTGADFMPPIHPCRRKPVGHHPARVCRVAEKRCPPVSRTVDRHWFRGGDRG